MITARARASSRASSRALSLAAPLVLSFACRGTEPLVCAPGYGWVEHEGCVAVDTGGASPPHPAPDPITVPHPEPWTADQAGAALQAALDAGLPDPRALEAAWKGAIDAGGTPGCPSAGYSLVGGVHGCTSARGWVFAGPADYVPEGDGPGFLLEADSYILRPDGQQLAFGGEVIYSVDDPDHTWSSRVRGVFRDDAATGWLELGVSSSLEARRAGEVLRLDGGSSVGGASIGFDGFDWRSGCPEAGAVTTVDGLGRGYRTAPACDGCGSVTLDGAVLGEVCLDLSAVGALMAPVEGT